MSYNILPPKSYKTKTKKTLKPIAIKGGALLKRAKMLGYKHFSRMQKKLAYVGSVLDMVDNGTITYNALDDEGKALIDAHIGKISGHTFLQRADHTNMCHAHMHATKHKEYDVTGERVREVVHAPKCKDRLCVVCNALRASVNTSAIADYLISSKIASDPNVRLVMLTFTIENPKVTECRNAINVMHRALNYLLTTEKNGLKNRFAPPGKGGYVRGTEIIGVKTKVG
ncbi:protein rep, partial [Helicobacter heilmannii]|uniref:protein rep n=1 Tax=Helicobacter heilmannii TaxID=35817 RepID=UPI001F20D0F0